MEIQLRSEKTGLSFVNSFKEAHEKVSNDPTIWKISFNYGDSQERFRLVYDGRTCKWENRPLTMVSKSPYCDDPVEPIPSQLRDELVKHGFQL